jgi:hypothetical protein
MTTPPNDIPLPPGATEDSADIWRLEGDHYIRWFGYRVWSGDGWEVRVCGIQNADGAVSDRGITSSDFTAGNAVAAQEFAAALKEATDYLETLT